MRALPLLIALVLPAQAVAAGGGTPYPGTASMDTGGTAPGQQTGGRTPGQPAGGTSPRTPQAPSEAPPRTPGTATLLPNGKAKAPPGAPRAVKRALRAGNRIQGKPYRFGGGHTRWEDDAYDCSGASSYVLRGIGGIRSPLDSTAFMRWGQPGQGKWITTYANANHMYVVIAGLRLDTGSGGDKGPRWRTTVRPPANFTARHPAGL